MSTEVMQHGDYLKATKDVVLKHGGLWFQDESLRRRPQRRLTPDPNPRFVSPTSARIAGCGDTNIEIGMMRGCYWSGSIGFSPATMRSKRSCMLAMLAGWVIT